MDTLDSSENSIYKLNRNLLHKKPATHLLSSSNGLIFSASEKAETFAYTYENQFRPNPGSEVHDVIETINLIRTSNPSNIYFTSSSYVANTIKRLQNRKALSEDTIMNTTLRNLSPKAIILLTRIINGCLRLKYFPDKWKKNILITIAKPSKDSHHFTCYKPITNLDLFPKFTSKYYSTLN